MTEPRAESAPDRARPPLVGPFGRRALRLGSVRGIEVGLDWSWVFIFLLITFSLARGFAAEGEALQPASAWAAGVLASLLFFTSILLHELGHSLTSNALGLPVRSITLFIFGGLARLSREPDRPRDELLIAAAGPAVSVLLGIVFLLLAAALPGDAAVLGLLGTVFGWLGTVNLALAIFNLVPGFPLDGGRILRGIVWSATGSFERATVVAAATGSFFAYLLIGGGILLALFFGLLFNGLWLAFIGWFLLSAAQGSTTQVVLQRQLGGLAVGPAAAPAEPVVPGDASVQDAVEDVVLRHGRRTFFVTEGSTRVGMATLHELRAVPREERASTPVRAVARPLDELVCVPHDASLWRALELMNEHRVNQLPVVREGALVGLLTRERLLGVIQSVQELGRS